MAEAGGRLLLDTCAVIWTANGDAMAEQAVAALDSASATGETVYISPISAWEVGMLVARGKLVVATRPQTWFARVQSVPGVGMAEMPPDVLIESSFLPGEPPRDPADRIIIATAREFEMCVLTRDRVILDYAAQGHVRALAC